MHCRECDVELVSGENFKPYNLKRGNLICRACTLVAAKVKRDATRAFRRKPPPDKQPLRMKSTLPEAVLELLKRPSHVVTYDLRTGEVAKRGRRRRLRPGD